MKRKPPKTTKPPTAPSLAVQVETTLGSELRRLKGEMGKAHQRYASEKDPAAAAPLFQAYLRVVAAVTALSKAAPKSDIETGNAIPASEVDATWSRHVKEWRTMLENLPRRAAMSPLFKRLDPVDVEQLLDKEVAQILVHLEASDKGWMKDKP